MNKGSDSREGLDGVPALSKALGMVLETEPKKIARFDVERYQAWLDDEELPDEQKQQLIEALWQIFVCVVDRGFGVSPLQDACGQLSETEGFCGHEPQDVVKSDAEILTGTFNAVAAG